MRNSLLALLVAGGLAGFSAPSWAAPPSTCPAVGDIGSGCNVLITIAASGMASLAVVNGSAYDGSDDQLVGIVNNSTTTATVVTITGSGIAGFDGDGAFQIGTTGSNGGCVTTGGNPNGCLGTTLYGLAASQPNPNDYEGSGAAYVQGAGGLRPDGSPAVTFASIPNVNTVVLGFLNGGLAPGQFAYFSLQALPSGSTGVVVPEPGSMALLGTALFGLYGFSRRRRRTH